MCAVNSNWCLFSWSLNLLVTVPWLRWTPLFFCQQVTVLSESLIYFCLLPCAHLRSGVCMVSADKPPFCRVFFSGICVTVWLFALVHIVCVTAFMCAHWFMHALFFAYDKKTSTPSPHTNIALVYLPRLVFVIWSLTCKNSLSAQTSHRCCLPYTCRALAGSPTLKWWISSSVCGSILLEERSRMLKSTALWINT